MHGFVRKLSLWRSLAKFWVIALACACGLFAHFIISNIKDGQCLKALTGFEEYGNLIRLDSNWQRTSNQFINIPHSKEDEEEYSRFARLDQISDLRDGVLNSTCGTWQENYIEFHKQTRHNYSLNTFTRTFIFSCDKRYFDCGGFGDQLLGIKAAFMLSLIFSRAFFIQYPYFDAAFQPAYIDWRLPEPLRIHDCDSVGGNERIEVWDPPANSDRKCILLTCINLNPWEPYVFEWIHRVSASYDTVVYRGNHCNSIAFLKNDAWWGTKLRKLGFIEETIPGCLLRFLIRPTFKLRKSIQEIESNLTAPNTLSLCIHARIIRNGGVDDNIMNDQSSGAAMDLYRNVEFLFQCAQNITDHFSKPGQQIRWFFASTSFQLKQLVYQMYPDKVLILDIIPNHLAFYTSPDLSPILLDLGRAWYLLSKCHKYTFLSSGFSKSAYTYSMAPNSAYMFPHALFSNPNIGGEWQRFCSPSHPSSLPDLAYEWSGAR